MKNVEAKVCYCLKLKYVIALYHLNFYSRYKNKG
jgi:hypothetical protein